MYFSQNEKVDLPKEVLAHFPQYQKENMTSALVSLKYLGINPEPKSIKRAWLKGLREWGFLGRYMRVAKRPLEIYDSAHNEDGLKTLFGELKNEK